MLSLGVLADHPFNDAPTGNTNACVTSSKTVRQLGLGHTRQVDRDMQISAGLDMQSRPSGLRQTSASVTARRAF